MKKYLSLFSKVAQNRLVGGSLLVFAGTSVVSFVNYLFHLVVGRLLGPADYGTLSSTISVAYLLGIPFSVLALTVVKEVSTLSGRGQPAKISSFYRWITRKTVLVSLSGLVLFMLVSPLIADYLHLESTLYLWLIGFIVFFGLFSLLNSSVLQGLLLFVPYTWISLATIAAKIIFSVILALLGFRVFGVLSGVLLSTFFGWWLSLLLLKKALPLESTTDSENSRVFAFALPALIATVALTSLYTTDIVIAKHYLSTQEAGYYAALAIFGKIIFFASGPVTTVMFPMISERHAGRKNYRKIFWLSFGLIAAITAVVELVYLIFSRQAVSILYGREYLAIAPYMGLIGLFLGLYSLSAFLVNYFLSIHRLKTVLLPFAAALLQVILLSVFHSGIRDMLAVSIGVSGLLLASLLLYFIRNSWPQINQN